MPWILYYTSVYIQEVTLGQAEHVSAIDVYTELCIRTLLTTVISSITSLYRTDEFWPIWHIIL